jgi:hypothetical protein
MVKHAMIDLDRFNPDLLIIVYKIVINSYLVTRLEINCMGVLLEDDVFLTIELVILYIPIPTD